MEPEGSKLMITVTDPLLDTSETFSFVTYLVVGSDSLGEFEIRRRYRDFHLLREKIVERWPGLYIPPISSKKLTVFFWIFRETQRKSLLNLVKTFSTIFVQKSKRDPIYFCLIFFKAFSKTNKTLTKW